MNTTFNYAGNSLQLQRWPLQQPNTSLQAWDAADELLILHTFEAAERFKQTHQRAARLLLINDSFGALSCALAEFDQIQISDSVLSEYATRHNREQNKLPLSGLQQLTSLDAYPAKPDIVLLKLPNNHSYLQYILQQLAGVVSADTIVLACAKAKEINRNVLARFSNTLGQATASLTVKKCRLIQCEIDLTLGKGSHETFPLRWPLENSTFTVVNHANVFSREKLDQGARFLLQHLPALNEGQSVVDLGCGNGVLGLAMLAQQATISLLFCDESYMAVDSARQTIAQNLPARLSQCRFITDDCLSKQADRSIDVVVCNPPFHQQHTVTSHIASQMFAEAKRVLKQGGRLRIVANRHLQYTELLQRLFGNCHQLAADPKFVILEVIKRS